MAKEEWGKSPLINFEGKGPVGDYLSSVRVCVSDLTTLVPPLMACMSTLQEPFDWEIRLISENSACIKRKKSHESITQRYGIGSINIKESFFIIYQTIF